MLIAKKSISLYDILTTFNGACDNLELTIDLMRARPPHDHLASSSSTNNFFKVGELITILSGFHVDMAQFSNPARESGTYINNCARYRVTKIVFIFLIELSDGDYSAGVRARNRNSTTAAPTGNNIYQFNNIYELFNLLFGQVLINKSVNIVLDSSTTNHFMNNALTHNSIRNLQTSTSHSAETSTITVHHQNGPPVSVTLPIPIEEPLPAGYVQRVGCFY